MDPLKNSHWITLSEHKDDNSIKRPFEETVFTIHAPQTAYRIFRLVQMGPNSMKDNPNLQHVFCVGGFELYGKLEFDENRRQMYEGEFVHGKSILDVVGENHIRVYSSEMTKGKGGNFKKEEPWNLTKPNSWFAIDFGPYVKVSPSLLNMAVNCEASSQWALQACNPASRVTLFHHENNQMISFFFFFFL